MSGSKKKERLVLLDTHAIIHRGYHALPEMTSPQGEPVNAVYGLATMLMKAVKDLAPDHIIAAYDLPGPTHRHDVYKEYKAKRPKIDDALISQIKRSRDLLEAFSIPLYESPGFEADDVIGSIALAAKKQFDVVIVSGDMDTLQLVDKDSVQVFTLRKGIQDTVMYNEQAVIDRYGFPPKNIPDYKGLAGDPSDNIIGIPGVGEKTATKLIQEFGSVEGIYSALEKGDERFKRAGFSDRNISLVKEHEDEALFSKVLATIRTDAPTSFVHPEKTFIETLDIQKLVTFFTELGFRSLIPRAKAVFGDGQASLIPEEKPLSKEDDVIFKESQVLLWLLNSEITNPSLDDILSNAKSDSLQEAHTRLLASIKNAELSSVYEKIEKPLIPVIDAINKRGVLVDKEYLQKLSKEYHKSLDSLSEKIYALAGGEFNINSPKQLGEILFTKLGIGVEGKKQKKTATGQLSTKESELQKLKGEHEIIEHILSYREVQKLLSTYIDAIPPLLDAKNRLHTSFIQTGTTTGRISSQSPNLQNIPIKTELGRRIRNAFTAPKGFLLAAFDYSQIELRLAALLSGDEKLTEIFRRGEDVHTAVAGEVFGVSPEKVDYEMRRRAKVINFGILYGMGVNALREQLGTDRTEAQAFYNRYFETFSGLAEYLTKTKASAARLGYTSTLFGRRRFFPAIRSKLPFMRAQAERMAINAPMQGTQSDIIKIAMVKIHDLLKEKYGDDAGIVLQIHDELVFELRDDIVEEASKLIKKEMENVVPKDELNGIPILVSSNVGPSWGELEKA